MEEKERYEYFFGTNTIKDNKTNQFYGCVVDLLNQQDKRIKELEEELKNYKLCRCVDCSSEYEYGLETSIDELEKENQQLKQQLHDLPKKIVEEIKLQLFNHFKVKNIEEYEKLPLIDSLFTADTVIEILDTILESLEGKMSKEELFKKYQEIVLKTNGGADDYVVALCQISNLIKEFAEEKDQQITDLQSQLAITGKALELACDYLVSNGNEDDELYQLVQNIYADDEYLATKINYFKTKAKEMLENE